MAHRVLHIGTPKTGTTYLQGILSKNRRQLREQGWLYPGGKLNQQHAVYGICGDDIHYVRDADRYRALGDQVMAKLAASSEANVMLSAEALALLDESAIHRFIARVGQPTKVLVTLRGLHKLLPSAWQQLLKTGTAESLDDYLERMQQHRSVMDEPWRAYAFGDVVRRWASFCPVEVVVVPSGGGDPEELWRLFRHAAGLPTLEDLQVKAQDANLSLSSEAASILLHLNRIVPAEHIGRERAQRLRKTYLNSAVFPLASRDGGQRITLPPRATAMVSAWNDEELAKAQLHASAVHGTLDDAAVPQQGIEPTATHDAAGAVPEVAARQVLALLKEMARRERAAAS